MVRNNEVPTLLKALDGQFIEPGREGTDDERRTGAGLVTRSGGEVLVEEVLRRTREK